MEMLQELYIPQERVRESNHCQLKMGDFGNNQRVVSSVTAPKLPHTLTSSEFYVYEVGSQNARIAMVKFHKL